MRPDERRTTGVIERLAWLGLALVCMVVLGVAGQLDPDPRGLGTHEQLGLPPCGFHSLTGLPCPGCGLTTAFSLVRQRER